MVWENKQSATPLFVADGSIFALSIQEYTAAGSDTYVLTRQGNSIQLPPKAGPDDPPDAAASLRPIRLTPPPVG